MTKERPDNPTLVIDIVRVTEWIIYPLELNKDLGQTIVMITHNPDAAAYGNRVMHMRDGQVVNGAAVH